MRGLTQSPQALGLGVSHLTEMIILCQQSHSFMENVDCGVGNENILLSSIKIGAAFILTNDHFISFVPFALKTY